MSRSLRCLALVGLLALPMAAHAQTANADRIAARREAALARREAAAERREAQRARREAWRAMTPEQREAARAARRARIASMPPEQQQYLQALSSYRQQLRAEARRLDGQVAAGTLTRDAMAQQLRAFRDANRPQRPAGMPPRSRGSDE